jgi:hypothetical protein
MKKQGGKPRHKCEVKHMREKDVHRELNDIKELLGETKFPSEPDRKPKRHGRLVTIEIRLARIEALLKKILEFLTARLEATQLRSEVGPPVPLSSPDPSITYRSRLSKGVPAMAKMSAQAQAGTKARVHLFPLSDAGEPRTIDLQDGTTTVDSQDLAKVQGVRVAEDGLSYIAEFLAVTDKNPDGSPITASLFAKTDADLDKNERRDLVSEIAFEIVPGPVPEASDMASVIGPAVPLSDPDPE